MQIGSKVRLSERLGVCAVVAIESFHTIVVRSAQGQYYRVSGLSLRR